MVNFSSFDRVVGSQADVKELQYIAALHQTCLPLLRDDCTVSNVDIARFLKSRFGMDISQKDSLRIVRDFGGGVIGDEVIQKIVEDAHASDEEEKTKEGNDGLLEPEEEEEDQEKSKNKSKIPLPAGLKKNIDNLRLKLRMNGQENQTNIHDNENFDDAIQHMNEMEEIVEEDQEPEEYLDLVQLLSVILMPTIARAGKEYDSSKNVVFQDALEDIVAVKDDDEENDSLRPKPEGIVEHVFHMLLASSEANISAVSVDSVRALLECHGEHERAQDISLLQKMVDAAGGEGTPFDVDSFVKALTSDMQAWQVGSEDILTTPMYDVWGYDNERERDYNEQREAIEIENVGIPERDTESGGEIGETMQKEQGSEYKPNIDYSSASFDFAIDIHSNIAGTALIWLFFILSALIYVAMLLALPELQVQCDPSFGCQLSKTIVSWIIIALCLTFTGLLVIIPLSYANSPTTRTPKNVFCSLFMTAIYTYVPYMTVKPLREEAERKTSGLSDAEEIMTEPSFKIYQNITFAVGNVLLIFFLVQFGVSLVRRRTVRNLSANVRYLLTSSHVNGCYRIKKAATRKINKLLQNAYKLHSRKKPSVISSSMGSTKATDDTMLNYVLLGVEKDRVGGLLWTWKSIFSRELFHHEGVWINTRLIIIQVSQVCLTILFFYLSIILTYYAADRADTATKNLQDDGIPYPKWVYDLVPTHDQTVAALWPANIVATLISAVITLIYLPSSVGTIIKYRCGMIESLNSPLFQTYRKNADTVYLNIGNAVYGMFGAVVLFWVLVALACFLIIWDFSRDFMLLVIAWGIGLTITILLKSVMTMLCRKNYYSAFYRTRPFAANLSLLALECWFIGLGGGIVIGRFTQFILAAAFWVGRIDVRFLSEDVNLLGYGFDYVPFNFEKELLSHDAHRHPYIDRLGTMYMMKLKYGDFGTDAGCCWRQLFVIALMPWMTKHRIFNEERFETALIEFNKKKIEREAEMKEKSKNIHSKVMDYVTTMGTEIIDDVATGGMGPSPSDIRK